MWTESSPDAPSALRSASVKSSLGGPAASSAAASRRRWKSTSFTSVPPMSTDSESPAVSRSTSRRRTPSAMLLRSGAIVTPLTPTRSRCATAKRLLLCLAPISPAGRCSLGETRSGCGVCAAAGVENLSLGLVSPLFSTVTRWTLPPRLGGEGGRKPRAKSTTMSIGGRVRGLQVV